MKLITTLAIAILLMLDYVYVSQKIYITQEIPSVNTSTENRYQSTNSTNVENATVNVPASASIKVTVIRPIGNTVRPYNDIILLILFTTPFLMQKSAKHLKTNYLNFNMAKRREYL